MSDYRIRAVDGDDDEVVAEIHSMHTATFGDTAPRIEDADFEKGHWWLAYAAPFIRGAQEPVAFAGLKPSEQYLDLGYLCRSGVMPEHRGHSLQVRLLRVREARARRNGWCALVTDTTDNVQSANSLIRAGYKLYVPKVPWGPSALTLYWRKEF